MVQLRSLLVPADNSGGRLFQVVHVYVGHHHKKGTIGDIVLAAVRDANPDGLVKKKEKVRMVIVRTKKEVRRPDGSYIRFSDNAGVVIDAENNPRGTRIFGPVAREIKDLGFTKIASLAPEIY